MFTKEVCGKEIIEHSPTKDEKRKYREFAAYAKKFLMDRIGPIVLDEDNGTKPDSLLRKAVDLMVDYKVPQDDVFRELLEEAAFCWYMRSLAWAFMVNTGMTDLGLLETCHKYSHCFKLFQQSGDWTEDLYVLDDEYFEHLKELPLDDIYHLGWLYQNYNSDLHDAYYAEAKGKSKKAETTNDMVGATGIYTPYWIVRYMVENSLGRLWFYHLDPECEGGKEQAMADGFGWTYYLAIAEQEPEVYPQLAEQNKGFKDLEPSDIKFIDPCMGGGIILLYAFDVFTQIYADAGIGKREAARSILENNLFGCDIDNKVWRVAEFSLLMRAAELDPTVLADGIETNLVVPLINGRDIDATQVAWFGDGMDPEDRMRALMYVQLMLENFSIVKMMGALMTPSCKYDIGLMRRYVNSPDPDFANELEAVRFQLNNFLDFLELQSRKYEVTCTNPPYLSSKHYSKDVKDWFNTGHLHFSDEEDPYGILIPLMLENLRGGLMKDKKKGKKTARKRSRKK